MTGQGTKDEVLKTGGEEAGGGQTNAINAMQKSI